MVVANRLESQLRLSSTSDLTIRSEASSPEIGDNYSGPSIQSKVDITKRRTFVVGDEVVL
ncbi:MAG: hypothetical protein C5B53_03320 [Candidatus Melainabacteria bacterium]|nr:MAG: hypothetical protein C5B53_03320 [Candidatus Melainabacteria bacterium]